MSTPTQAGFLAFLRSIGIAASVLPDDSIWITYAFDVAVAIVNLALCQVPVGPPGGTSIYTLAVYNLAASNVINYAQDVADGPTFPGSEGIDGKPLPWFAGMRRQWGMGNFSSGVVSSVSDVSTSTSLEVIEAMKTATLADLQYLKDPYGRAYLGLAQRFGTLWNVA